jgi:hypothetical protein
MTVCAWAKLDPEFVDNDARLVSKATGIQEQDHWWMLSTATSGGERRLRARLKAGGSTTTLIAGSGTLALNSWLHLAASYDGAALRLFVNGVETGSTPKTGAIDANSAAPIWIGANPPAAYAPFHGLLDDVRIYNTSMNAANVTAVMNDTAAKPPPRLMKLEPGLGRAWSLLGSGSPGHYLHLERAGSLRSPDWQLIATEALVTPTVWFHDSNDLPQAFYQLKLE